MLIYNKLKTTKHPPLKPDVTIHHLEPTSVTNITLKSYCNKIKKKTHEINNSQWQPVSVKVSWIQVCIIMVLSWSGDRKWCIKTQQN